MTIGFIFPGQGSQSVGMLASLAASCPEVEGTFADASRVLGYDLWRLIQAGPEAELNRTDRTQPAMLAAGVAVWRTWQSRTGLPPACMAGHSLGEYTALVCAGAIGFEDAVSLVADRSRFMQEAVPLGEGAMAAILGLEDLEVAEICAAAAQDQVVAAVNFNSPGQVVVAGAAAAVERAIVLAKEAGARRAVRLPVSVPSHCDLMRPAAQRLAERLKEVHVSPPAIPVIHNADVARHADPAEIRHALVTQLYSPVRWVGCVRAMAAQGVTAVVECGPGKVLTGLNKRIEREMEVFPIFDPDTLAKALEGLGGPQP